MTELTDLKKCTGCQACRLICPERCISFKADGEGFLVPDIDQSLCTDCGLCVSRCPANNSAGKQGDGWEKEGDCSSVFYPRFLGAKLKDSALLSRSASGGVFAGIASKVLKTQRSVVFGCAFDDNLTARHTYVIDIKDITPLQSSKYVQSDVGDTYLQVKSFLDDENTVFYTGVPCQIAGLYTFLGGDHENLLTADLICHGVPSPLLFRRYLDWLGGKYGGEIVYYDFRSKEINGWSITTKIKTGTKTRTIDRRVDPYVNSFLNELTFRECCYTCRYANCHRVADITFGDFWGVENTHPEFYSSKGVSVVLINTKKGEHIFKILEDEFDTIETKPENVLRRNRNLQEPSPRPKARDTAYDGVGDEKKEIFKSPVFKIDTKTLLITYIKKGVKLIIPSPAIDIYRKAKRKLNKNSVV